MRIALTVPADSVNERTLGAAAEAATNIAHTQIERGRVPPLGDVLRQGLVRWAPEPTPPGEESFDIPQDCLERGWGDCDDLAPWWAGELRASNVDPDAKAHVYKSSPKTWHVVVKRGDGTIDDPSKWAGMGSNVSGTRIPAQRPLGNPERMVVGFARLSRDAVQARLDFPITGSAEGVSLECIGQDALKALHLAANHAGLLAWWGVPDEIIARLFGIQAALSGVPGDYSGYGPFVNGIAAHVDAGQAANLAAAFIDPLGIHNLIAPLAQSFVSNYAQGLGSRGASKSTPATTSGDSACPAGFQWELHNGEWHCVPHATINGRVGVTRGGASRGAQSTPGRGGGRGTSQSGTRDANARQTSTTAPQFDPQSGFFIDQESGLFIDPFNGELMDPSMQWNIDLATGMYTGPSSIAQQQQQQQQQQQWMTPAAGYGLPPGYAPQQYSYPGQQPGFVQAPGYPSTYNTYPAAGAYPYPH